MIMKFKMEEQSYTDVEQRNTNISFRRFKEHLPPDAIRLYQSQIRFLTLHDYFFKEFSDSNGYYIATTTGIFTLNMQSGKFYRMREKPTTQVVPKESLTFYEPKEERAKNGAVMVRKYYNRIGGKITKEVVIKANNNPHLSAKQLAELLQLSVTTIYKIRNGIKFGAFTDILK